ncbi:MAG: hypothetical protein ACYDIE_06105 [Candidatus Krumholzibacteriia bacterium]
MKRLLMVAALSVFVLLPLVAQADPQTGIYTSTDLGGSILTGRASTWRPGVNSGLPHVAHIQSWNGTSLGTQWDISCPTENSDFLVQDNRVSGVGTIVYTSTFTGGTFTLYPGAWPWGDGSGTLYTTTLITTVQYYVIGGVSTPVASVVNGNTSGLFSNGCLLTFAIGNGAGVGETPYLVKPATYPTFLDGTCAPASPSLQYGTWGNVMTLTLGIDCTVADVPSTWGSLKSSYR